MTILLFLVLIFSFLSVENKENINENILISNNNLDAPKQATLISDDIILRISIN